MVARPKVIAFDVIETMFSLEPLRARFETAGLQGHLLETWFATSLRDAFALAAAGGFQPLPVVLEGALDQLVSDAQASRSKKRHIVEGMKELPAQPDAAPALKTLKAAGFRVVTVSNGAAAGTRGLLAAAGLEGLVEQVFSVDDVRASKPRAEVYRHTATSCGVQPGETCLIAAHPWDVNGAKAAGLIGAHVARAKAYPASMAAPDLSGQTLVDLADALAALR